MDRRSSNFDKQLLELYPKLRSYAIKLTQNVSAGEDLVQTASLRMMDKWSLFAEGSNFSAWSHRIVLNEFLSNKRRDKSHRTDAIENYEPTLRSNGVLPDIGAFMAEVEELIKVIPADQRDIVRCICIDGLSYEEAALDLDVTIGTIKSRLWRSRSRLESLLGL